MIALRHDQLLQIFDIDPDEIADVTAEDGALEQVQYLQKVLLSMKHPLATQMGKYGILQVNQYGQEGLKRRHAMEYIEFYQHARNSVKKSALFLMMEMQEDTSSGQDKAQLYFVMSGDITESKEGNEGPHFVPTGIFCCTGSTNIPTTVSCNNIIV